MEVEIKRLREDIVLPEFKTAGSVGFDIAAAETTKVPSLGGARIPTGLIVAVPAGYMLMIAARSSTAQKHGLLLGNGIGVIDQDYRGPEDEIKISVYNFTDREVIVEKGVAVAQGIFVRVDRAEWSEVSEMNAPTRGGFGSTDK